MTGASSLLRLTHLNARTIAPFGKEAPLIGAARALACTAATPEPVFIDPKDAFAAASRFWARVQIAGKDDCWLWKGWKFRRGYGEFRIKRRKLVATRVAWVLTHGSNPDGLICHACDNPPCVNPAHLWVGTPADNHRDMVDKGRAKYGQRARITHCHRGHEFTPENTRVKPSRPTMRTCRICDNFHSRNYRRRLAEQKAFSALALSERAR